MCVFLISPVPITEPLTSELIDTPVFYNLAPRPIKYRISVPIPKYEYVLLNQIITIFYLYFLNKYFETSCSRYTVCIGVLHNVSLHMFAQVGNRLHLVFLGTCSCSDVTHTSA